MYFEGKRVLVTGAAGFIGSHLTEELLEQGAQVTALIRYNSRSDFGFVSHLVNRADSSFNIIQGDLRDQLSVRDAVRDQDIVFHLGALIAIPYSYLNPWDAFETNVRGTLNVLEAVKEFGVARLVHTSTSETYGTAEYVPIDELHPLKGQSPYSASKIAADKFVESYFDSYGLPVRTIRPFNTYGPRQSARAIIPTIISQAIVNNKLTLGSLEPRRDLTFVKDTVSAFLLMGECSNINGEVINIGSNFDISIGELVKEIENVIGKKLKLEISDDRIRPSNSEVMHLLADNSKAKKLINWSPQYNLKTGLQLTVDWIEKNIEIFNTERYII